MVIYLKSEYNVSLAAWRVASSGWYMCIYKYLGSLDSVFLFIAIL